MPLPFPLRQPPPQLLLSVAITTTTTTCDYQYQCHHHDQLHHLTITVTDTVTIPAATENHYRLALTGTNADTALILEPSELTREAGQPMCIVYYHYVRPQWAQSSLQVSTLSTSWTVLADCCKRHDINSNNHMFKHEAVKLNYFMTVHICFLMCIENSYRHYYDEYHHDHYYHQYHYPDDYDYNSCHYYHYHQYYDHHYHYHQ